MLKFITKNYLFLSSICLIAVVLITVVDKTNEIDPTLISGKCNDTCTNNYASGCIDHGIATCGGDCTPLGYCVDTWEDAMGPGVFYIACNYESTPGYLCSWSNNVITCRKRDCNCAHILFWDCHPLELTGATEKHNICTTVKVSG